MQYAFVDGERLPATPRLRGECPHCGATVLSRCGDLKVWHWSHLGKRSCDPWWEPETEWHLGWKGKFPVEWHEVGHRSLDGERHIADLKTPHGLVVEFQHSVIADTERTVRTAFYGNMVWVVDGLRRKRDRPRFSKSTFDWTKVQDNLWTLYFPEEALPKEWFNCKVPVFFDFGEDDVLAPGDPVRHPGKLWCLLPSMPNSGKRLITSISVPDFIANVQSGHPLPDWADTLDRLSAAQLAKQRALTQQHNEYEKRLQHYQWARRNLRARHRY